MAIGGRVETLLKRLGFQSNPFLLREADREDLKRLASYFFHHHLFAEILGNAGAPENTVVLAERGGGKTTFRQAIEFYCRDGRRPVEGVLDVAYVDFSRLLHRANRMSRPVDIYLHVDGIMRAAVQRLLESLDEVRAASLAATPASQLASLSAYIRRYSRILNPADLGHGLTTLLKQIAAKNELDIRADPSELLGPRGGEILAQLPALIQPVARLLLDLSSQPRRLLSQDSYLQLVREFIELIAPAGFAAMYVLVDRLDETSMLARPEDAVRFLQPLITSLDLLDTERMAFKFFLPQHLEEHMVRQIDFRRKRLMVRHLAWSEQDLVRLLEQRLQSFSKYNVTSMSVFCEPELARRTTALTPGLPDVRFVDATLVKAANHLPRDLILRCHHLFESYESRQATGLISEQDLIQAISIDLGDDLPSSNVEDRAPVQQMTAADEEKGTHEKIPSRGLYIDRHNRVWRDGELLGDILTPTEFKLLKYLATRRYELCSRAEILSAVWRAGEEDAVLNTALKRLRREVEPDPKRPRFVVTVRGRGVRLEDGLAVQDGGEVDQPAQ